MVQNLCERGQGSRPLSTVEMVSRVFGHPPDRKSTQRHASLLQPILLRLAKEPVNRATKDARKPVPFRDNLVLTCGFAKPAFRVSHIPCPKNCPVRVPYTLRTKLS